jgi:hypothetical protein
MEVGQGPNVGCSAKREKNYNADVGVPEIQLISLRQLTEPACSLFYIVLCVNIFLGDI